MKLMINRTSPESDKNQTLGYFVLFDEGVPVLTGNTLELPWKDNKQKVSCIPKGFYVAKKRWSEKYGDHYEITDVEDRSLILIHPGNYRKDTKGCVILGHLLADIDGDKYLDVINSNKTIQHLHDKTKMEDLEVIIS